MLSLHDDTPAGQQETERVALRSTVSALRDFAMVFRTYDARWMRIEDLTVRAAEASHQHFVRERERASNLPTAD